MGSLSTRRSGGARVLSGGALCEQASNGDADGGSKSRISLDPRQLLAMVRTITAIAWKSQYVKQ